MNPDKAKKTGSRPAKAAGSVLVVSGTDKGADFIRDMLDPADYFPVTVAESAWEARGLLADTAFDYIIINAPLPDEFGYELARSASEDSSAGVILIVKSEFFDETCYRVEEHGVFTLAKPLTRQLFTQALRLLSAARSRLCRVENENRRLQVKLEETRTVDRAKWALIEYLKMDEKQAYKYIEKQAMDMRTTKLVIAENIIKTYGEN